MDQQTLPPGDLRARVISRAATDEDFHRRLLEEPKTAIEEAFGLTLPLPLDVVVMEETPSRVCLVLPMRAARAGSRELSDEELARVAGGGMAVLVRPPDFSALRQSTSGLCMVDWESITPINLPNIV
jgi:hypothetical protein